LTFAAELWGNKIFAAELWENKFFAAELWENKIFAAELCENNNFHLRNNGHLPLFLICRTLDTYCGIVTATLFHNWLERCEGLRFIILNRPRCGRLCLDTVSLHLGDVILASHHGPTFLNINFHIACDI
jgi:hypothetical protein